MKFRERIKPYGPIIIAGVLVAALTIATAMQPVPLLVAGAFLATLVAFIVTIEYLILVPVEKNPAAKRLVGLLVAVDLRLFVSVLRYCLRDYWWRQEILTLLFWGLAVALAYLGWHIWKDQVEGARAYRDKHRLNHPEKGKDYDRTN